MSSLQVASREYSYLPIERVHFGPGSIARLSQELDRVQSHDPFIITERTIAENTRLVDMVKKASGRKLVGVF